MYLYGKNVERVDPAHRVLSPTRSIWTQQPGLQLASECAGKEIVRLSICIQQLVEKLLGVPLISSYMLFEPLSGPLEFLSGPFWFLSGSLDFYQGPLIFYQGPLIFYQDP